MDRSVTTVIDKERCIGCGLCVKVCPLDTISIQDGKAAVTGKESLSCSHCAAACPEGAITVNATSGKAMLSYSTFKEDQKWLKHGDFDTSQLVRLMRSRRSCRNYRETPVDRNMLEDLVKIGITAPSGTNSQGWTFTILPARGSVHFLANQVARYFKELNNMAEKSHLRLFMKLTGNKELDFYYKNYYERVKETLSEWEDTGRDRLFHGATSAIIVGCKPGSTCPAEDALLATQNILLGAHSMGLGSCLIGFAVSAMQRDPKIKLAAGIPANERIYAVIALGWPDEKYFGLAGRKPAVIRYFDKA
ncbi:MAG: 4Fe-4S dicluster domain-containing protein [Desulfobacteraceae bacterium]|nr:MAG: 4Fe-4S dicluster domain-containing protein [Desulfobacteraceae bacterium]